MPFSTEHHRFLEDYIFKITDKICQEQAIRLPTIWRTINVSFFRQLDFKYLNIFLKWF